MHLTETQHIPCACAGRETRRAIAMLEWAVIAATKATCLVNPTLCTTRFLGCQRPLPSDTPRSCESALRSAAPASPLPSGLGVQSHPACESHEARCTHAQVHAVGLSSTYIWIHV